MRNFRLSIAALMLCSAQALAGLLDDVVVTPLPGTASCYPGTAGADAVMFIKTNVQPINCNVFGGGDFCLARREFAGDGANGRDVSLLDVVVLRPSVTGAGDFVAFTERGFNVCFMQTAAEDSEVCFGRDQIGIDPHSAAYSPDGVLVAITRLDPDNGFMPTNDIFVVDTNLVLVESYEVLTAGPGGSALQVETVDFTVDGDYLIFDAFNPVSGLWGIYAVSRSTGATLNVVAPVAGLIIRSPSLAQTSDDYMVFDAADSTTFASTVLAANLRTGALSPVAATDVLGFPSYTGDDGAVVFDVFDNAVNTLTSMDIQTVAADRLTPVGSRTRWLDDGGVPAIYRRGTWNGTLLDPALCGDPDEDGDGIADSADNCLTVANADQRDTDADSIGNACDADLNADCSVNFGDLAALKAAFIPNPYDEDADFNGDGFVNFGDLAFMKSSFFNGPNPGPGPSGLPNDCE